MQEKYPLKREAKVESGNSLIYSLTCSLSYPAIKQKNKSATRWYKKEATYTCLHSHVLQRIFSNPVHREYSAILSHSPFHPVVVKVAILARVALNEDAFLSSKAIWIQLYGAVHPKCLDDSEQMCKDQGANWGLSSFSIKNCMDCTCELSLMSLNTSFLS